MVKAVCAKTAKSCMTTRSECASDAARAGLLITASVTSAASRRRRGEGEDGAHQRIVSEPVAQTLLSLVYLDCGVFLRDGSSAGFCQKFQKLCQELSEPVSFVAFIRSEVWPTGFDSRTTGARQHPTTFRGVRQYFVITRRVFNY